ncbi:MAG: histidine kinase [Rhodobacterales bacterium CG_4_9_14_3_um_filter_71_31]|nr:MAG: histidine kinase [Rhodobacterales bacterium CG_4_9_14_3_um_filter_71_31]
MPAGWALFGVGVLYLMSLFAVAWWGERRAREGRSLLRYPAVYALSIAVYCTSWTFYGSVGRAAETGLGFLPIYLGPTLGFCLGWMAFRKILAVAKAQRITSIADFIAARYGKSQSLGAMVALIAVVGTVPYIALQLKAVTASVEAMTIETGAGLLGDTALGVAAVLAAFAVLFGARHIDATEHHEGVVVAIAFESAIKLVAFLAVGFFVVYGMYDGLADVFTRAAANPGLARLMTFEAARPGWVTLTVLAAAAIFCLPRQFQVTVVGCVDENHLRTATWAFPLYLLAINIFVLPIALAGLMEFPDGFVPPDTFVLALPLSQDATGLALLVFLGGLSASTAMVIMATIALGGMVCNDVVMPSLLRATPERLARMPDVTRLLLRIRRFAMVGVLALGYGYYRLLDGSYALVSIGLVSFAAAAQFAPVLLGAVFWRGGTRRGAMAGLAAGFVVWLYTLFLPSFTRDSGFEMALFGLEILNPYALGGVDLADPITHSLIWSWLANIGFFVGVSLFDRPSMIEKTQATLFVEALRHDEAQDTGYFSGAARYGALKALAERFVGPGPARRAFAAHARGRPLDDDAFADAPAVRMTERLIAGSIGAASARAAIASAVRREGASGQELLNLLDETTQVMEYSRQLEAKSRALEEATAELRAANRRLTELDRMKDEFLSTVSHELRTPLTSIRAFTELMRDEPEMSVIQREEFLDIVIRETERLTRLINQVLDIAKMESGRMQWRIETVDLRDIVRDATASARSLFVAPGATLEVALPDRPAMANVDRDRLYQVVVNLVSNARKFIPDAGGLVRVTLAAGARGVWEVSVADNGPGVAPDQRELVFDRFHQAATEGGNPTGTGLGLAISRMILDHLGGRIWVAETTQGGADFRFSVPAAA